MSAATAAGDRLAGPPQPVKLRLRDGRRCAVRFGAIAHMGLLTELLHFDRPGLVEVVGVGRLRDGRLGRFDRSKRENFVAAGDRAALLARVRALAAGDRREVFFTPATLSLPMAGNEAVAESAVAWVDIDDPDRITDLRRFPHAPHAVIASGSGGVHAYWRLAEPISGERCEEVNRKLAAALGADLQSCNRGRIMRVPGTLNWKHAGPRAPGAWGRVMMCDLAKPGHEAAALSAGLSDPRVPMPHRARRKDPRLSNADEPWKAMEPADYYRAIAGLEPRRDGKVRCPNTAHEDCNPSAHLYSGPGAGWFCFSCGAGGGAVDMVAAMRGWPTGRVLRGEQFSACVAELRRIFGVTEPDPARSGAR